MHRCGWARTPIDIDYHDAEWGVPVHDDRLLFEFLILEGAQAGLSWTTILNKRESYRAAFEGFEIDRVAKFTDAKKARLLENPGIVRNRLKVDSAVRNAKAAQQVIRSEGSLDAFLWSFVGGKPLQNARADLSEVPAKTPESDAMSKALKKRGFNFVGSTICYAFMQAVGMVNDHETRCFRYEAVKRLGH
ncbi:MAG: DNA-3-methyladenine glycosylase I [Bryobacterales bacterium]|nr:DNA-3-methyladenine glycosylase I [Bryobacterales bacterium]